MGLKSPDALAAEVARYLEKASFASSARSVEACVAWLSELVAWNARLDLTAAKTAPELVELMIGDSVVLAGIVPGEASVVDVGTGAGAPGLGLACLRPDLRVTLVEPLQKRCAFLRQAIARAKLTEVRLVHGRMESAERELGEASVLVSRATFAPAEWLEHAAFSAAAGSSIAVLLAREPVPADARVTLRETHAYTLANSGRERTIAIFERIEEA
jgi:16S rRNA (guanine527-N7)-methyltransferase